MNKHSATPCSACGGTRSFYGREVCRFCAPLTKAQQAAIDEAANKEGGLIDRRNWPKGIARAAWSRKMDRLCELGYFKPYVHGGYELTERGAALANVEAA